MTPSFYREKGAAKTKPSLCFAPNFNPYLGSAWKPELGGRWVGKMALAHTSFTQPHPLSLKGEPRVWTGVSLGQQSLPCLQHHTLGPSRRIGSQDFGFHLLGGKEER